MSCKTSSAAWQTADTGLSGRLCATAPSSMTPLRNLMIFPSDGRIGRMPGDAGLSGAATQRCSAMPWAHSWKCFLHPPIERLCGPGARHRPSWPTGSISSAPRVAWAAAVASLGVRSGSISPRKVEAIRASPELLREPSAKGADAGLERIILDQPFFAGLGPEFGTAISGCARNLRFTAGNICFARANRPTNFICCGKAPWPWSCIRLFNSRWSLRPCAKATSSTGRGWCRPVSGHSMRARQSSCGCSGSTLAAFETNARLITTSATSARILSPDWWGRYPRSDSSFCPCLYHGRHR